MFITKKKYEKELEKARRKGYEEATKDKYLEDNFRAVHDRIDRLIEKIKKPNTIGFTDGGATK